MLMVGVRGQHSTRSGKGSRLLSPITCADHPALAYVGCSRDSLRISAPIASVKLSQSRQRGPQTPSNERPARDAGLHGLPADVGLNVGAELGYVLGSWRHPQSRVDKFRKCS